MNKQIVIAGFGGQGVLFSGKFLAYAGMMGDYQISWLPSYGPEMRGGTANCNVIISDDPIGSPIIVNGNALIAMNAPSFTKFVDTIVPGGEIFVDSTLISDKVVRTDVKAYYVPATAMAKENNLQGLSNMIMVGKFIKETGVCPEELIEKALHKCIPAKKADMFDMNMKAIRLGMEA